ncbi:MAG: CRISPR-associated protein Cas4 [bacterium]
MYSEDDLLPISGLQHLLFCERRAALVHIEQLWENNLFTAEGAAVHEKVDLDGFESRKDIRYATGLRIRSFRLGLIGRADLAEFRQVRPGSGVGVKLAGLDGEWLIYPVEYKRGEMREEPEYEVQLCAQAICFEEMLGTRIDAGCIYYAKSKRRHEVIMDEKLRQKTATAALRLHELTDIAITPAAEYGKKCRSCSMVDVCVPKAAKGVSAKKYIADNTER